MDEANVWPYRLSLRQRLSLYVALIDGHLALVGGVESIYGIKRGSLSLDACDDRHPGRGRRASD